MIISCPSCQARYRIDTSACKEAVARVKCPGCSHAFQIDVKGDEAPVTKAVDPAPTPGVTERSAPADPVVVLVVDDARFFREMIKDILKDLPVELEEAADGEAAWQRISAANPPRLVLLDLNIPGRSGKEIIAELGKLPSASEIRVLAMSGVERGEETALELRRIGADDFINKSFKPAELQDRVRKILGL